MFRIEFFVEDKNLGEAFKRLAGIARNLSHNYVPNLETKRNGKTHVSAADSMEMFLKELHRRKVTDINADIARSVVSGMGFSPSSYSHFLTRASKEGYLTSKKVPGRGFAKTWTLKAEK